MEPLGKLQNAPLWLQRVWQNVSFRPGDTVGSRIWPRGGGAGAGADGWRVVTHLSGGKDRPWVWSPSNDFVRLSLGGRMMKMKRSPTWTMTSSSRTKAAEDDTPNWEEKTKNKNKKTFSVVTAVECISSPALLLRKGQVALRRQLEPPGCGHRDNVDVAQYFFKCAIFLNKKQNKNNTCSSVAMGIAAFFRESVLLFQLTKKRRWLF